MALGYYNNKIIYYILSDINNNIRTHLLRDIDEYFSVVIHLCTALCGIGGGGGGVVRAWANHSCRPRRRGDVVFNVRLGVCLCSFPPYITLYDPYRTALAPPSPPPRPSLAAGTKYYLPKTTATAATENTVGVLSGEKFHATPKWKRTNHSRRIRRRRQRLLYTKPAEKRQRA